MPTKSPKSKPKPAENSPVESAVRATPLDLDELVARVDAILKQPIYWYPVRHHSPTIGRHIAECIRVRKPKIVFIEGPHEAQAMIEYLLDAKTKPPVAIYSSFRFDSLASPEPDAPIPRTAVWYPMVSYSPEYLALAAAKEIGAKTVFMDLPHYATEKPSQVHPNADEEEKPDTHRRDLDELVTRSDFYQMLTRAGGFRSFGETWDALFELPRNGMTYESLRRDVALFCAAVRETTHPDTLERDGTLPRERFMWKTITETLKDAKIQPKDAMVVCGGFHIFLDQNDLTPPPEIPRGTLSVTVAPYSYFRISELSGYGAGNRAPRFYELCNEHHTSGVGHDQVIIDYVIDVLREARSRGENLSSADAIGATQAALMLARLRGRSMPVLDDLHDALITCCCKGNPKTDAIHLLESIDEINIGTKLGRVTDRMGRLPIINDFYQQLEKLKLEEVAATEKVQTYVLDKRQPDDAARSAFLHRLLFLGVEIGSVQRENQPFGQSIFKEHWRIKWSPKIEAALIEKNLHGDSIESAATTVLRESLGKSIAEAGAACRRLVQAVDMDLPLLVTQAEQGTGYAIDHDERFGSLSDAQVSLMLLERYAAYRGLGKQQLADLINRCFDRACFAIPEVASVPPEQWDEVIQGLQSLAEPVVQRADLDADLFAASVQRAASVSTMPFLRGAFLGVLTEMKRMKPDDLAAELSSYARGSVEQQLVAGDFLHGILRVPRTAILLGARSIVEAVDELLRNATSDAFLSMVPSLRAAFETLHDRQRDNVAIHVAELYGIKESESLRTLQTSVGAAQMMASLDAQVAKIMNDWLDEKE